jgi:uracil-DNA glycosylase family 4
VPGEGSADSRVMFIGEGPGRTEDEEGRPFVGRAGQLLDDLLVHAGLVREEVFICNVVRCRPPRNRAPRQDEIRTCIPYLDRQIKAIHPHWIVTLGNHATAYAFDRAGITFDGITKIRGQFIPAQVLGLEVEVFPVFHPAAALYNPVYVEVLTRDFQRLGKKIEAKNGA